MTQEATLPPLTEQEQPQAQAPDIKKNLFWDDVRIGLKVVCSGLVLLMVGLVISRYLLPEFLVVLLTGIGCLVTLFGVKITCSVPDETGVNLIALGALKGLLLCFLGSALYYFFRPGFPWGILILAVALGAAGHVAYAFVLWKAADYLKLSPLRTCTMIYLAVAAVFSLVVFVFAVAGLFEVLALRIVVDVLAIITLSFLAYNVCQMSRAIAVLQQEPAE